MMPLPSSFTLTAETGRGSACLHLDNRPPFLRRLLGITGIQQLFAQPHTARQQAECPRAPVTWTS